MLNCCCCPFVGSALHSLRVLINCSFTYTTASTRPTMHHSCIIHITNAHKRLISAKLHSVLPNSILSIYCCSIFFLLTEEHKVHLVIVFVHSPVFIFPHSFLVFVYYYCSFHSFSCIWITCLYNLFSLCFTIIHECWAVFLSFSLFFLSPCFILPNCTVSVIE